MRNIILMGTTGLVSGTILKLSKNGNNNDVTVTAFGKDALNLASHTPQQIRDTLLRSILASSVEHETCVINAMAITDHALCEQNPELAMRVNAGVYNILSTLPTDIHYVHISTDAVFRGQVGGMHYTECDVPEPSSVYSATKIEAERIIRSSLKHYTIVRCVPIGHRYEKGHKTHFIDWVLQSILRGDTIHGYENQHQSFIYVWNLAQFLVHGIACNPPENSIVHANDFSASKYDIVRTINELFHESRRTTVVADKSTFFDRRMSCSDVYTKFAQQHKLERNMKNVLELMSYQYLCE